MAQFRQPLIALPANRLTRKNSIPHHEVKEAYIRAVIAAGGLPVLLPAAIPPADLPRLVSLFDGFLFCGGGDLEPGCYGGSQHPNMHGVNPERDAFELALVPLVVQSGKPLLGICRGMQVLNVALGGDLYGDLASQLPAALKHDYFPGYKRDLLVHDVTIETASQLAAILGEASVKTNSIHHQAVRKLASDLRATAFSADGVIEAVEMPANKFVLGVQWHPEWLQNSAPMRAIFTEFVRACEVSA